MIRKLTRAEVPDGSLLLWASDIHIGIEHTAALKLMVDAAEWAGVTHVVAGGDIVDLHCVSRHEKDPERILAAGTILEEIESGRWFIGWLETRPSYWILGNHEDRLRRFFIEHGLSLIDDEVERFRHECRIPTGIEILPNGSDLRLGNLNMSHGDWEFVKSAGGKFPAQRLLDLVPDFSSICGHVHRESKAKRTSRDADGNKFSRGAWTMGHMSVEEKHHKYAGKYPNWQTGFGLIRVWYEGLNPRWQVYQVEVMFDRRGRPYFELFGRVFQ